MSLIFEYTFTRSLLRNREIVDEISMHIYWYIFIFYQLKLFLILFWIEFYLETFFTKDRALKI